MSQPTAAWLRVARSGSAPIVMMQLDLDGSTSVKYVSGDSPVLSYQPSVASFHPSTARVDPITRRVQAGDVTVTLKDSLAIRSIVDGHPLKGHRVKFFVGFRELTSEADWYRVGGGAVDEVVPARGLVNHTIRVADAFGLVVDKQVTFEVLAMHPLTAIKTLLLGQDGEGLNLAAELVDATSLDPDDARYDDNIGHWLVGRSLVGVDERSQLTPISGLKAIEEVAILCGGGVVPTNEAKLRFARYDHTAANVRTWDKSIVRGLRQKENLKTLVNHATMQFGWSGGGDPPTSEDEHYLFAPAPSNGEAEFRYAVDIKDADSVARYVFGSATAGEFYKKFSTKWFGYRSFLENPIDDNDTSVRIHSGWIRNFCGSRTTGANAAPSAARPVYLRIDDEIIKMDAVVLDSTVETIPTDEDPHGNPGGTTPSGGLMMIASGAYNAGSMASTAGGNQGGGGAEAWLATYTVASSGRGAAGTVAAAHALDAEVIDVTIAVQFLQDLVARCSDGLKIIECDVPIWETVPDYGDNVGITHDAFLAFGQKGLVGTEKWEVIGHTDHYIGVEPHRSYLLASVRTPPAVTHEWTWPQPFDDGWSHKTAGRLIEWLRNNDVVASSVLGTGFTITNPSSRNILISSGTVMHRGLRRAGAKRATNFLLAANRDHYIYWDAERGVFLRKDVATGGGAPVLPPSALLLAKCVVGASSISLIDQSAIERKPIHGTKLKEFTGPLTKLDDTGRLVDPVIKDTDASPVNDRQLAVIDGVVQVRTTGGVEQAGALAMKEPIFKDSVSSDHRKLKVASGKFITLDTSDVEQPTIWASQVKMEKTVSVQAPSGDGKPIAEVWDIAQTNYILNPSFEVNVTDGWSTIGSPAPTVTRDTATKLWGDASMKVVTSGVAGEGVKHSDVAALPSQYWTFSAFITGSGPFKLRLRLEAVASNGTTILGTHTADVWIGVHVWSNDPFATRAHVFFSGTPASTAFIRASIYENTGAARTFYVDGVQLEKSPDDEVAISSYLDGSLGAGYQWSGTPNNSASTRAEGHHTLSSLNEAGPVGPGQPILYDDLGRAIHAQDVIVGDGMQHVEYRFDGLRAGGMADDAWLFAGNHMSLDLKSKGDAPVRIGSVGAGTSLDLRGAGSSFPSNPQSGEIFFRTDRATFYYYDGTRWLSVEEYTTAMGPGSAFQTALSANPSTGGVFACPDVPGGTQVYLTRWSALTRHTGAPMSSNYWTLNIRDWAGNSIGGSFSTNGDTSGTNTRHTATIGSVRTLATDIAWYAHCLKAAGTPGNLDCFPTLSWRLVG